MSQIIALQVPRPGLPFELVKRRKPEPGPGQVRVKVYACGVCRSDEFTLVGLPGAVYPLVPGHEVAGVVDAAGPDVAEWRPGERAGLGWFGGQCGRCDSCRRGDFVMCVQMKAPGLMVDGGYAEYVVAPANALVRLPAELDFVAAAPLMCAGVTAFNALRTGNASPGDRVAVVGIGGVGHLAVQFAAKMGCETIAISRGRRKEELARRLGAHHFIDVAGPGVADELMRLGGADLVVSATPNGNTTHELINGLAARGRLVITGFADEPIRVAAVPLIARGISITGTAAGTAKDVEQTLEFCVRTGVRPVTEEFPLAAAASAYERMLSSDVALRAVLRTPHAEPETPTVDHPTQETTTRQHVDGAPAYLTGGPDAVLDCPYDEVPDPEELIAAAMRWHFSPETGSPFWLRRAKTLDFDPIRDVRTFADLRLFPNVVNELRDVSAADLVPRGYGDDADVIGVFESGGTTGPPKRVVLLADWMERWLVWAAENASARGYPVGQNALLVAPTGPHMLGYMGVEGIRRGGGIPFTIDLDPRWVRTCVREGRLDLVDRYSEHLIDQCRPVLETQDVATLVITPPLLERLARDDELVKLVNEKVKLISWGGVHMDADTRHLFRTEVFPGLMLHGGYGSTMVLGGSTERPGLAYDDPCIFDPFSPYISFSVVDPGTLEEVPYGERGRVVMNHLSKSMLLPNNLERDTGLRMPPPPGRLGDSVADVMPVEKIEDEDIIEGVY
jgi:2-desacetyl-2-hydroxyethyl bacteriochlorophyllide A dehydrogenase